MRRIALLVTAGLMLPTAASAAATCLRVSEIKSTDSDGKSLTLTMKNGAVWQSRFPRPCSGIRFSGFNWEVRGGEVCENAQVLRVIATGAICTLGTLTPVSSKPAK